MWLHFYAEPVLGAGGVIVPPEGYHKRTWDMCKKYDALYVSDEVVTAFGRLGRWFASKDEFEIEPDIITCAKGLYWGYLPLGATIFSDDICDVISAPDSVSLDGPWIYVFRASGLLCSGAKEH